MRKEIKEVHLSVYREKSLVLISALLLFKKRDASYDQFECCYVRKDG